MEKLKKDSVTTIIAKVVYIYQSNICLNSEETGRFQNVFYLKRLCGIVCKNIWALVFDITCLMLETKIKHPQVSSKIFTNFKVQWSFKIKTTLYLFFVFTFCLWKCTFKVFLMKFMLSPVFEGYMTTCDSHLSKRWAWDLNTSVEKKAKILTF